MQKKSRNWYINYTQFKPMQLKLRFLSAVFLLSNFTAFAQSSDPAPYCDASFDDMDGSFNVADHIKSVSLGTLSNVSNAQFAFPHYVFYNNLAVPNFSIGSSYSFSIALEVHGGAGYGVWIDYNHNSVFEQNEKVAGSISTAFLDLTTNTVVAGDITISPIAMAGQTRMRVRIVEDDMYTATNGAAISACNASASAEDIMDWGETEDYIVNIVSTVGINAIPATNAISVYPNPVVDILTVNGASTENYRIFSVDGTLVKSGVLSSNKTISTAECVPGFYVIQLLEKGVVINTSRFVKAGN